MEAQAAEAEARADVLQAIAIDWRERNKCIESVGPNLLQNEPICFRYHLQQKKKIEKQQQCFCSATADTSELVEEHPRDSICTTRVNTAPITAFSVRRTRCCHHLQFLKTIMSGDEEWSDGGNSIKCRPAHIENSKRRQHAYPSEAEDPRTPATS